MFVIKNIVDSDVVLDDLRLVLGPGREIDLDKVATRHLTDYSVKLRMAINQQRIRVVVKDPDRNIPGQHAPTSTGIDKSALESMENRLKTEFSKQITSKDDQITMLTEAIKGLVEQLKNQPPPQVTVVNQGGPGGNMGTDNPIAGSSIADISDDIASSIHAKAMKRMEKNVIGHVEHEDKKIKDDSLNANINELEGLL